MALFSIAQDVGADKGFLLSEVGFQSGAIRAARVSNIILTNLQDLSSSAKCSTIDALVGKRYWAIQKAKDRLLTMKKKSHAHEYSFERRLLFSELGVIESMFSEALEETYPIKNPMKGVEFSTLSELLGYADKIIDDSNNWNPDQNR